MIRLIILLLLISSLNTNLNAQFYPIISSNDDFTINDSISFYFENGEYEISGNGKINTSSPVDFSEFKKIYFHRVQSYSHSTDKYKGLTSFENQLYTLSRSELISNNSLYYVENNLGIMLSFVLNPYQSLIGGLQITSSDEFFFCIKNDSNWEIWEYNGLGQQTQLINLPTLDYLKFSRLKVNSNFFSLDNDLNVQIDDFGIILDTLHNGFIVNEDSRENLLILDNDSLFKYDNNGKLLESIKLPEQLASKDDIIIRDDVIINVDENQNYIIYIDSQHKIFKCDENLNILEHYTIDPIKELAYCNKFFYTISSKSSHFIKILASGYTIKGLPRNDGYLEIALADSALVNSSGEYSFGSNTINYHFDKSGPLISNETEIKDTIRTSSLGLYIEFNEFTILEDSAINITGHPIQITSLPDNRYSISSQITLDGQYELELIGNKIRDKVGNKPSWDSKTYPLVFEKFKHELKRITPEQSSSTIHLQASLNYNISLERFTQAIKCINGDVVNVYFSSDKKNIEILINPKSGFNYGVIKTWIDPISYVYFNIPQSNEIEVKYISTPLITGPSNYEELYQSNTEFHFSIDISKPLDVNKNLIKVSNGVISKIIQHERSIEFIIRSWIEEGLIELILEEGAVHDELDYINFQTVYVIFYDQTNPNVELIQSDEDEEKHINVIIQFDDEVPNYQIDPIGCLIYSDQCFGINDINVIGADPIRLEHVNSNQTFNLVLKPIEQKVLIHIPNNIATNFNLLSNEESNLLEINYPNGLVLSKKYENPLFLIKNKTLSITSANYTKFLIYTLDGQLIYSDQIVNEESSTDLNSLSDGVYIIHLLGNSSNYYERILLK